MLLKNFNLEKFKEKLTLLLLVGIPWSWKSSWIEENKLQSMTLSPDALRLQKGGIIEKDWREMINNNHEKVVFKELYEELQKRLEEKKSVIIDATNLNPISLHWFKKIAKKYKAHLVLKVWDASEIGAFQEVVKRNFQREKYKQVPLEALKNYYIKLIALQTQNYFNFDYTIEEIKYEQEIWNSNNLLEDFKINPLIKIKYLKQNKWGTTSHFQSYNFSRDAFSGKLWNEQTIKARWLFVYQNIDKENPILARSYDKFFNFWELSKTRDLSGEWDNYKAPFKLYAKENGYLWIVAYNDEIDDLVYCSKSTNEGWFAENIKTLLSPYAENIKNYLKEEGRNKTLVFEIVDQENDAHIIPYKIPKSTYLLDVIENNIEHFSKLEYAFSDNPLELTCAEVFRKLTTWVDNPQYPMFLKHYVGLEEDMVLSIIELLDTVETEGYVVEDAIGNMFKFKSLKYSLIKSLRPLLHSLQQYNSYEELIENQFLEDCKETIQENISMNVSKYLDILASVKDKFIEEVDYEDLKQEILTTYKASLEKKLLEIFESFFEKENFDNLKKIKPIDLTTKIKDIVLTH